jgi:hypothetical protein
MKHLLNDLSEEVKNSIREQHSGGKKIVIENFNKLVNTKSGDVKLFLNEQAPQPEQTPSKEMSCTLLGYLAKLGADGAKKGIVGLQDLAAVKETKMYLESLRDGKTPTPLSKPAEIVKKYAMDVTKTMPVKELIALNEFGKTYQTKM